MHFFIWLLLTGVLIFTISIMIWVVWLSIWGELIHLLCWPLGTKCRCYGSQAHQIIVLNFWRRVMMGAAVRSAPASLFQNVEMNFAEILSDSMLNNDWIHWNPESMCVIFKRLCLIEIFRIWAISNRSLGASTIMSHLMIWDKVTDLINKFNLSCLGSSSVIIPFSAN